MASGLRNVRLSTVIITTAVITLLFLPLTVSTNNNASLQSQSVFAQQQQTPPSLTGISLTCLIGGDGSTATGVWQGPQEISPPNTFPAGAPVAMFKQTDNVLTALAVDNNGALSVSWVVGTGVWQGPKEISPQGIFPAGAPVAMFKQTDNVLTALAVDNNGALAVSWVVGTGVWQGPQEISSQNTFPAGAGIGMFRQTDNVLTALAVKNNGALAVSWVDMGTPPPPARSEVWQGPQEISPPNTFPAGAPVAMFKQTDNQLISLAAKNNGALAVSWVVGTGVWLGAYEISSPSVFPAETHVAIAKQTDNVLTSLAVENNGALAVSWSDTDLTCPTVLGGIGGGGSGTIEPGNPNPSPGSNTPPPLSPETQRKIEFYKKEICSPGNPPPLVQVNCPDTQYCKYGAIKWSIFRTCEEIYPEYYNLQPIAYSPTSNNPVDDFIRRECADDLALGHPHSTVSYAQAIYFCSQNPFSPNFRSPTSIGVGSVTTPCQAWNDCKNKFTEFIERMEQIGLPTGILRTVENSPYTITEGVAADSSPETSTFSRTIMLKDGTLNSAAGPIAPTEITPVNQIYHESVHAYLDIMKYDPQISRIISDAETYYASAPLENGSTATFSGRLVHEVIAEYVGTRLSVYYGILAQLTNLANQGYAETIERQVRLSQLKYDEEMADQTYGTYEGIFVTSPTKKLISPELKAFLDNNFVEIPSKFYDVPAFQDLVRRAYERLQCTNPTCR